MGKVVTRFLFSLWLLVCFAFVAMAEGKTLDIAPIIQDKTEWCWLASGEMILEYFDEPKVNPIDNQCGIIGLYLGPASICWNYCGACNVPAYTTEVLTWMLSMYPPATAAYMHRPPALPIHFQKSTNLTFDELKDEIDNDRPVLAGINPDGGFQLPMTARHAVVIIGYEDNGEEDNQFIVVNDPFPYASFGVGLYEHFHGNRLTIGRYRISYKAFKDGLHWSLALYHMVDPND